MSHFSSRGLRARSLRMIRFLVAVTRRLRSSTTVDATKVVL